MARNYKFSEGEYYHIYDRGVEKRIIFTDKRERERFMALLFAANSTEKIHVSDQYKDLSEIFSLDREELLVDIGVYVLMPNHFHLLIREKQENGISKFMQKLLTGYTMYFNKKHHRTGALFEGVFKGVHVDEDRYLKYLYAYIHLNPIGIIDSGWKNKKIEDKKKAREFIDSYPYSSFFDYTGKQRPERAILSQDAFPQYFMTIAEFDDMIEEWITFTMPTPLVKAKP